VGCQNSAWCGTTLCGCPPTPQGPTPQPPTQALLGDLDSRLSAAGAPPMDSRERAVAIKKLLVATATRGVDFAMDATLEEVMRFRNFHGSKQ